ncbi:MAG TPA: hypothetical protein VK126_03325 [Nitrososphaerales archaeon]|nr:hypothetical protein [Nitrososphaerales archaeon]
MSLAAAQRNLPPEWNGIVPTKVFFDEAMRIIEKSTQSGLTLRVMGGVGIALQCADERNFALKLGRMLEGRQEYTDLDFAGLFKERNKLVEFFSGQLGYGKRKTTIATSISQRQIYFHPDGYFTVDVLMDKLLIANHPIDFRSRLGVDPTTLSIADLLLEKIQMWVSFSEKDIKDCLLLLKAHEVSEDTDGGNRINAGYIAKLLSDDWGFYYTATTNLQKIAALMRDLDSKGQEVHIDPSQISAEEKAGITAKVERILKSIEDHPKTIGWKARSKLGTRKQWYRDVETQQTVGDFGIWRLKETTK